MTFDQLGLSPELLRAVADAGYTEPTPVQREAIPHVLAGRDLLAAAQTGTGKTAAFVLPILQRLATTPSAAERPGVRVLVLTPTRELAVQIEESVRTYGAHLPIRSAIVYGGMPMAPQVAELRRNPEIVVATPGRLLDHTWQGNIDYGAIEPLDPRAVTWTFSAQVILRARTASRLQRDFDLDAHALSVVLRFLERVEALEAQVRALRAQRTR